MVKIVTEISDVEKLEKVKAFLKEMGLTFQEVEYDKTYLQEELNLILKGKTKWLDQQEFESRLNVL